MHNDVLAVEEPLEMRLVSGTAEARSERSISITMRTPGNDLELAAGFFYTEGIIQGQKDIEMLGYAPGSSRSFAMWCAFRSTLT